VKEDNGPRTHEPNLRELTADLDGLRELILSRLEAMEKLASERDRWYTERDKDRQASVDKALTAVKEQTAASFAASEKAILKAEEAQRSYNASHNDLARKMDDQGKATMPRTETESRFFNLTEKVEEVRRSQSTGGGLTRGGQLFKDESRTNIALAISVVGIVLILIKFFKP
jgi:hypothetical protein